MPRDLILFGLGCLTLALAAELGQPRPAAETELGLADPARDRPPSALATPLLPGLGQMRTAP